MYMDKKIASKIKHTLDNFKKNILIQQRLNKQI